jgi:hypothetical protein
MKNIDRTDRAGRGGDFSCIDTLQELPLVIMLEVFVLTFFRHQSALLVTG